MKVNYKFKTKPYLHQEKAWLENLDKWCFAYFMEMERVNPRFSLTQWHTYPTRSN